MTRAIRSCEPSTRVYILAWQLPKALEYLQARLVKMRPSVATTYGLLQVRQEHVEFRSTAASLAPLPLRAFSSKVDW